MRKWHRWVSVIFGVFLLWISATGIASHVAEIIANGGLENEAEERAERLRDLGVVVPAPATRQDADADAPAAGANPNSARAWTGFFHELHSGEFAGPVGKIISLLSGLSLFFFAFSGLWMYIQMYRGRLVRVEGGKKRGKFFW